METAVEQAPAPALADRRASAVSTASTDSEDCAPLSRAPAHRVGAVSSDKQLLAVEEGALSLGDSSLSDCRDSGVEADSFVEPDEATALQLVEAVEFYFDDENLLKDAFLLKHVKRNKEGFVSLKLMSSFKRVKHISRDWRVVAFAMRRSTKLEVNDTATKVRRLAPLPEHDETITSRTIVAVNLPLENPTIATVLELFGACGDISSIRVLKPGTNIPVDVRAAFNKHPDIAWENVNCAVVEFDLQEQARKAKETMSVADDADTSGMHIIPIGKVSNKKKSRQEEPRVVIVQEEATSAQAAEKKRRQKRKKMSLVHMESSSSMSGTDGEFGWSTPTRRLSAAGPAPQVQRPPLLPLPPGLRAHRLSPPSRPGGLFACTDIRLMEHAHSLAVRGKANSSPNVLPPPQSLAARQKKSNSFCGVVPAGHEQCPWVARRKASGLSDADRRGSLMTQENVMRAPRGPDGSRGFARRPSRSAAVEIKAPPPAEVAPAPARRRSAAIEIKAPPPADSAPKASAPAPAPATAPAPAPSPATAAAPAAVTTTLSPTAPPFVPAALAAAAAPVPAAVVIKPAPTPVVIKAPPADPKPAPADSKPAAADSKPAAAEAKSVTAETKPAAAEAKQAPATSASASAAASNTANTISAAVLAAAAAAAAKNAPTPATTTPAPAASPAAPPCEQA
ncbi:la-related protein 6-like [Amphibalanus amphitrite]|uniref:la-related protein 6-like n=1 Tax=Amphibalanus amphitrite TaxID=1232801 RepID=UPI001C90B605|nr:la-related protein 6-like [Amphibalanus amphitrite]